MITFYPSLLDFLIGEERAWARARPEPDPRRFSSFLECSSPKFLDRAQARLGPSSKEKPAGTRKPYFTKSIFVTSNIPDLFLEGLFNLLDLLYSKMTLRLCTLHTCQSVKLKTNYRKVKSQSSHQNQPKSPHGGN